MADETLDIAIKVRTDDLSKIKQTGQELKAVGQAAQEAGKADVEATEKALTSKEELKKAIEGLKEEFPGLAHIAKLAMNPIAFVVAGVGAAFAIWKERIKEAQEALGAFEMPDLSEAKVGQVTAMAKAWADYSEAIQKAAESYNSVEAQSDRAAKRLDAEADRNKKLLESQKNLALAKLEADKANLKPGEYEQQKAGIEDFYEKAGVKADRQTKFQKLEMRAKEADRLAQDAKAKLAEAGKIKVGTPEQDQQTEADLKAQADAANESQKTARKRRGGYAAMMDKGMPGMEDFKSAASLWSNYGFGALTDPSDAIAQENANIANAQPAIDAYAAFMKRKGGRERARKRRGELVEAAGKEQGEAATIGQGLFERGGELDQFDADVRNQGATQKNDQLSRAYRASGEINNQARQTSDEISKSVESGSKVLATVVDKLASLTAAQVAAEAKIKSLENTRKLNPPMP